MPDIMILLSLATYFVIINDQFMSLQRNKFIDRFKTQIIKPSTHPSGEKTDRQMQPNSSTHLRSINTKHSHSKSLDIHEVIVRNLEKHITYLEKKLKDEEQQTERTRNLLDAAQRKIVDLDTKHHELVKQMEELHECLKKTERNYDMVRSDYQNLVLKQKMEKLSGQVNQKKQAYARLQLRHNFKKGRFSSAFLPTSFGSPGKYKERNEKQYKPIIKEYEVKNMEQQSVIAKQAYENCISNEYRLIKEENDELVKKVQELSQKNAKLIQQLNKKDQSHEKQDALQAEIERLFKENQELKLKIEEILSQNKRFLSKIAQNEQKMIEISMVLNQRSSSVSSLQHNSIKIEKQIQTERLYNPEAKSQTDTKQLEERIQILTKKMQEKDEEVRRQKIEDNSQVKDLFNLMKKCNEQISEIEDIQQETRPPQNGQILEEAEPQKCKQEEQATQNNNKAASQSEQKQKITCESVHQ